MSLPRESGLFVPREMRAIEPRSEGDDAPSTNDDADEHKGEFVHAATVANRLANCTRKEG